MRQLLGTIAILGLGAGPALAHPHIFIDAGLTLMFDSRGQLAAVRVTWAYDEFYSLMQLADLGLDRDGDGVLTAEEGQKLAGYDTNWVEGYEGDLYLTADGAPVRLAGPAQAGARLEEGRIVSWHIRPLIDRIDPEATQVVARAYDPGFYTAYTTDLGVRTSGREGCEALVTEADLGRAYDIVEDLLYGDGGSAANAEDDFPAVGEHFADTVTLTCVSRS